MATNQENLDLPVTARSENMKITDVVALDKLSLDSPQSRSPLTNVGNLRSLSIKSDSPDTPTRMLKRKCMSALESEKVLLSSPKSSKDFKSDLRAPLILRARRLDDIRTLLLDPSEIKEPNGIVFTRKMITHEFDMAEGMADGVSETMAELFTKPIKMGSMLPRVVEDDEGYPRSEFVGMIEPQEASKSPGELFKLPEAKDDVEQYAFKKTKRAKSALQNVKGSHAGYMSGNDDELSELENSFGTSSSGSLNDHIKCNRAQSESDLSIINAVERIGSDPSLIGDGSKQYLLPILPDEASKHQDLKEISRKTLASLFDGKFNGIVDSFEIIDCRYPYEFQSGHIKKAINLHTERQIYEHFIESKTPMEIGNFKSGRHIVIFHCEFSSQRGPTMCRYLRDADRRNNGISFPSLHYPELYVLFGGYKEFFEQYPSYCDPENYLPMVHSSYVAEYRFYKAQSKTDVVNHKKPKSKTQVKSFRKTSMKKLVLD